MEFKYDLAVVGLGYVGLPLAVEAASAGLCVAGLDVQSDVVLGLKAGRSHLNDVGDPAVAGAISRGFTPTVDEDVLEESQAVVVCVPTPLNTFRRPDLTALTAAVQTVARHLMSTQLVVIESTSHPGTTEEIVVPILEANGLKVGADFHCAFSPERIDPGNGTFGVRNTPKVVGGVTTECRDRAAELYGRFIDEIVLSKGTREAEFSKLLENTFRLVNISMVNELAVVCHELGIDIWDAIECASSKPFGYMPFWPGPGAGGHCIPVDPLYLSDYVHSTTGRSLSLIDAAAGINDAMPTHIYERSEMILNEQMKPMLEARVTLIGVSYKANIGDVRESPATPLADLFVAGGANLSYCDPHVDGFSSSSGPVARIIDLEEVGRSSDLAVILQAHRAIDHSLLNSTNCEVLDTRRTPGLICPSQL